MKLNHWFTAAGFAILLGGAGAALGETFVHEKAGVQFDLPNGWHTNGSADALDATSKDGSVTIWFDVVPNKSVAAYLKEVERDLSRHVKNAHITQDETTETINGLKQHYIEGTGTMDGHEVHWDFTLVETGKANLGVLAAGENLEGKTIKNIYASIKKPAASGFKKK